MTHDPSGKSLSVFCWLLLRPQPSHSTLHRARWWSPDSINTTLSISEDGVTWTVLRSDLVPTALSVQELWYAEQPLQVRQLLAAVAALSLRSAAMAAWCKTLNTHAVQSFCRCRTHCTALRCSPGCS